MRLSQLIQNLTLGRHNILCYDVHAHLNPGAVPSLLIKMQSVPSSGCDIGRCYEDTAATDLL